MANEPQVTIVGNLTADPELRFTPSGAGVANFTVAVTPRTYDRQTQEWVDGDAAFYNCAVWREYAENVAESLQKGQRVVVTGKLVPRSYERRDGGTGLSLDIQVDEVGHSLRFGTAHFTRSASRGGGQQGRGGEQRATGRQQQRGPQNGAQGRQQQYQDPWASSSANQYQGDPWNPGNQEPPY